MSGRNWSKPYTPSAETQARYCRLMLAPPEIHGYYRAHFNEALQLQREGDQNAYFSVRAIDRQMFRGLTGLDPSPNARRILAGCTLDGDYIPHTRVVTVQELMDENAARAHHAEAVGFIGAIAQIFGDLVSPIRARSRSVRERFARERDVQIFDAQLAIQRLLALPLDETPIAEGAALVVTVMLVPKNADEVPA